jgi:hypothetical protein
MGLVFYAIAGLWGLAVVMNLVIAARICQAIQQRSGAEAQSGLPSYAAIIPVAFNRGVAQDDETQDLRKQMNKRLIIILIGFAVFFFFVRVWDGAA